jgi:type II secretory pathway pseudopilin PulG
MIVGILAGLAMPNLRYAMLKAEASRLVSEAHTVRLAAFDHLGDNGSFPPSSGFGSVPPALKPYLPENYAFTFNKVNFAWTTITLPNTNNRWQSRNLGILMINYSARPDLAEPMQAHVGIDAIWSATNFYYLIPG